MLKTPTWTQAALKVALAYFVLAALWILTSDWLVASVVSDPIVLSHVQTYKGLFYVFATTVFLFAYVQSIIRHIEKVKESQQRKLDRFKAAVDVSPLAIFTLDTTGRVLTWNRASEVMFGFNEQDIKGKLLPTIPEDRMSEFRQHLELSLKGEVLAGVERVRQCKDGSRIDVRLSTAGLKGPDGQIEAIMAIMEDISERKRMQRKLEESEQRYHNMFDNTHTVMLIVDPESSSILDANPAACRFYGYPVDVLKGMSIHKINIDAQNCVKEEMGNAKAERSNVFSFRHRLASGMIRDVEVHSGPIQMQGRTLLYSIIHDVTERKLAQDDLRHQTEILNAILDNAPIMTSLTDRDGKHLWVNRFWEHKLGWTLQESREQDVLAKAAIDKEQEARLREGVLNPDGDWHDFQLRTRSGELLDVSWSTVKLSDKRRISIGFDISNRVRAEKEKEHLEQQFRQAQKMEAVGRLAGGIAHDFNNLLTGITGNVDLSLMDLDERDPFYTAFKEIRQAANRAAALTRQLLAFSRKQIIDPHVLALNQTVTRFESMLQRLIGEDIHLKTQLQSDLGLTYLDSGQLEQILVNLVVNARDAMPDGGDLLIETSNIELGEDYHQEHPYTKPGSYVMLAVSDNGSGIEAETLEHIFEPFFTTKPVDKGTGLGLATVFGIVKQSKGSIEVYSEIGEGTTFKLYFPRIYAEKPAERVRSQKKIKLGSGELIMIVEDEDVVRNMNLKMLTRLGYRTLSAPNGEQALIILKQCQEKIDLLMTDVVMPDINGRELAKRALELQPDLRVLYTSGYTENVIVQRGVLKDGVEFIGKPYSPQALAEKIRCILHPD